MKFYQDHQDCQDHQIVKIAPWWRTPRRQPAGRCHKGLALGEKKMSPVYIYVMANPLRHLLEPSWAVSQNHPRLELRASSVHQLEIHVAPRLRLRVPCCSYGVVLPFYPVVMV